jgi:site-specific DNA-adenine methylase
MYIHIRATEKNDLKKCSNIFKEMSIYSLDYKISTGDTHFNAIFHFNDPNAGQEYNHIA